MEISSAKEIINMYFKNAYNIYEINRGVMNFKFQFSSNSRDYILRCYPKGREYLAELEFKYLSLFISKDIKAPVVKYFSSEYPGYIIYEKINGVCLSEIFENLTPSSQINLCNEITENYKKISYIKTSGCGVMLNYNSFIFDKWKDFLLYEINKSLHYLNNIKSEFNITVLRIYLEQFISKYLVEKKSLVWSDFHPDNIIVSNEGKLAGFIDFEGLIGGDPLLGLGYLQAKEYNSVFFKQIYSSYSMSACKDIIDFYSIVRYLRLVVYEQFNLPNGSFRTPIKIFLPYSYSLIKNICHE